MDSAGEIFETPRYNMYAAEYVGLVVLRLVLYCFTYISVVLWNLVLHKKWKCFLIFWFMMFAHSVPFSWSWSSRKMCEPLPTELENILCYKLCRRCDLFWPLNSFIRGAGYSLKGCVSWSWLNNITDSKSNIKQRQSGRTDTPAGCPQRANSNNW